ncbi:Glutathione synthetase [hydrothermal vent metagenome]|uniref:glutathione synthase n=1 Tax=hydrothermal vent metagenome TaxID=652676 RepID=A0A3B1AT75_9ZZZZ
MPSRPIKLGVIMDPIGSINLKKDSTLAMLLEARQRGWELHYMEQTDLSLWQNQPWANTRKLTLSADPENAGDNGFSLAEVCTRPLAELDVVLMRKDPPFDMDYIFSTYLLELAEAEGVLVVNRARSLRDANEKLFTAYFPQCTAPMLVSAQAQGIRGFLAEHGDIILKPLDGMGGASIFRVQQDSPNIGVIIETLTRHGQRLCMAQKFIPEINQGDKRILLIDGEPVPYALARIPQNGETRGNLAVGGIGKGIELNERDRWICQQVAPELKKRGLIFVGLDVIGDYLTEINVTSPTCIRELDELYQLNISASLMDVIEQRLQNR